MNIPYYFAYPWGGAEKGVQDKYILHILDIFKSWVATYLITTCRIYHNSQIKTIFANFRRFLQNLDDFAKFLGQIPLGQKCSNLYEILFVGPG